MPHDYDDYDDEDFGDIEEDDRDASYYECMWGGPEDEELEEWYEEQEAADEDQEDYGEDDYGPADFDLLALPVPAPEPEGETASRQHFVALKRKYKVESFKDTSPLSPLYKILLKIESSERLNDANLSWLKLNRLGGPIRIYARREAVECENRFKATGDRWEAVKASRFWRMAKQPTKALAVTKGLTDGLGAGDSKLKSAILTTRGGAFRDQRQLGDAEACGQEAIQLDQQSFYPYTLLGAVYYQKGDPQRGDEFFAAAEKLGAKPEVRDRDIRRAVSQAGEDERQIVAQYLLEKDPARYRWARKYLQ
jgi:hypothetical protein